MPKQFPSTLKEIMRSLMHLPYKQIADVIHFIVPILLNSKDYIPYHTFFKDSDLYPVLFMKTMILNGFSYIGLYYVKRKKYSNHKTNLCCDLAYLYEGLKILVLDYVNPKLKQYYRQVLSFHICKTCKLTFNAWRVLL